MFNDIIVKYRLESLKIAYGVIFNGSDVQKHPEQIKDDIKDVFSLADMNLAYVLNGVHPSIDDQMKEDN